MICILCNSRKAKRRCPAAQGDICPQCCAEQREQTLDCPLDCEYLIESRKHERVHSHPPASGSHPEVEITDDFMNRNDMLLQFMTLCIGSAVFSTPGVTDADVREGMDATIQTLKTAQSGLIYETKPANPFAASIQEKLTSEIERLRKAVNEQAGGVALRDKDILGVLVFLARVAVSLDNGRRKGRSFMSLLRDRFGLRPKPPGDGGPEEGTAAEAPPAGGGLIITP